VNAKQQDARQSFHSTQHKCKVLFKTRINEYISTFHSFDPKQQGKGKGCFTFALAFTKAP